MNRPSESRTSSRCTTGRSGVRTTASAGNRPSAVTTAVTREMPETERFVEAGRVAHTVAQLAKVSAEVERPWVAVADDLEVEEWKVVL